MGPTTCPGPVHLYALTLYLVACHVDKLVYFLSEINMNSVTRKSRSYKEHSEFGVDSLALFLHVVICSSVLFSEIKSSLADIVTQERPGGCVAARRGC